MTMQISKTGVVLLSILILASGHSQTGAQERVVLRRKFLENETVQRQIRFSVVHPGYYVYGEAILTEQTRRVLPDGSASLHSELKDVKARLGEFLELDLKMSLEHWQGWDCVCTVQGRVRDTTTLLDFPEMRGNHPDVVKMKERYQARLRPRMNLVLQAVHPVLPAKPVRAGDTYQAQFGGQGQTDSLMRVTVVSIETKDGRRLCSLKLTALVPTAKGSGQYQAEGVVDSSTGRCLSLTGSLTGGEFGKTVIRFWLTELSAVISKDVSSPSAK